MDQNDMKELNKSENWNKQKIILGTVVLLSIGISNNVKSDVTSKEFEWISDSDNSKIDSVITVSHGHKNIVVNNTQWTQQAIIDYDFVIADGITKLQNDEEETNVMLTKMLNETIKFEKIISRIGIYIGFTILLLNLFYFNLSWTYAFMASIAGFGVPLFIKVREWERG